MNNKDLEEALEEILARLVDMVHDKTLANPNKVTTY